MTTPRTNQEIAQRLAQARLADNAAKAAIDLLGALPVRGQPDMVTGECGHPMSGRDWVDGWRVCSHCPQEPLFDLPAASQGTPPGAQP